MKRRRVFAKRVKRVIYSTAEHKHQSIDVGSIYQSVSSSPIETVWGLPIQGNTSVTRIGRKIAIHSFVFHGTLVAGCTGVAATDDGYNRFRIVLALWDGSFTNPMATLGVTTESALTKSFAGVDHLKKKYWDKKIILNTHADLDGTGALPYPKVIHKVIRFKRPIVITTRDDTTLSPDKVLYLGMVSDSLAVPNPGFLSGAYAYIRFTDI